MCAFIFCSDSLLLFLSSAYAFIIQLVVPSFRDCSELRHLTIARTRTLAAFQKQPFQRLEVPPMGPA